MGGARPESMGSAGTGLEVRRAGRIVAGRIPHGDRIGDAWLLVGEQGA